MKVRIPVALPCEFLVRVCVLAGLYGRLDGNGHFKTAMTTVQPNSKGVFYL
jgi:hypothetical protein